MSSSTPIHSPERSASSTSSGSARPQRRDLIAGVSLATLCLIRVWTLLTPQGTQAFYTRTTLADLVAVVFELAVFGVALAFVLKTARDGRRWMAFACQVILLLATVIVLAELRKMYVYAQDVFVYINAVRARLSLTAIGALAAVALTGVLAATYRWGRWVARGFRELLLIFAPLVIVALARIAWLGTHPRTFSGFGATTRAVPTNTESPRRVIIFVFDEFDFGLAFARRPAGLRLPNADRLRAQAIFADSALPPAHGTEESMPSYLVGQPMITAGASATGRWVARRAADSVEVTLPGDVSLFTRSAALGARSGIVGFHLPYCRIAGDAVSRCDAWPLFGFPRAGDDPVRVMLSQLRELLPWSSRRELRVLLGAVASAADRDIANDSLSLLFLHLPSPHPPAIFNSATGKYTMFDLNYARGYIGNLALTDRLLGHFLDEIDRTPRASETMVIVTSDHPWRDAKQFAGASDPRIPFMVFMPGRRGEALETPMHTVHMGDMALAYLRGELPDEPSVVRWLRSSDAASASASAAGARRSPSDHLPR